MKKHELLKYAYDNYPKGTKINWNADKIESFAFIVDGKYNFNDNYIIDSNDMAVFAGDKWAEIIPEKPNSILDGKCAIQVNNERQFKLLMDHYESKGWKSREFAESFCNTAKLYPFFVTYEDGFSDFKYTYIGQPVSKIIPFSDFAKEVGITVPVFIMKSEDGVDLYEGDIVVTAHIKGRIIANSAWVANINVNKHEKENYLFFSSLTAAEKWIEEQNKPKHYTVKLYRHKEYKSAEVTNDKITIRDGDDIYYLKASDIEDMYHALKSL